MAMFQGVAAQWAALIGMVLANLSSPTQAQAPPVSRLCGFDTNFGDGADITHPRSSESRVEIDLQRGSVRFTSPGSGNWLVPNHASISKSTIGWWVGIPDGTQKISYSIDRASGTYTSRLTFGGNEEPGGSRGSCLPKKPF